MKIQGSVGLVTGANRGIGAAIVRELVARGAKKVYAGARDPATLAALVKESGGRVVPLKLDVTKPAEIDAAAAAAMDVQILVNNAGVALGGPLLERSTIAALRGELEVNVIGVLLAAQAFAPILKKNGGGAVVNMGSVASFGAFPVFPTYSASKAAVHSLTQSLRALLAPQKTSVHGVYPGPIDTDMAKDVQFEKTPPSAVAKAICDAIESGTEEVLTDPLSKQFGQLYARDPKALEREIAAMGTPA